MLKALLIDDEKQSRNALREELGELSDRIEIIGEADSVKNAIIAIEELHPDVVFLDIHLGDGLGFDVLGKTAFTAFNVIFVTAYDQYAIKAFNYGALHYILKPVHQNDLRVAVEKIKPVAAGSNNEMLEIIKKIQFLTARKVPVPSSSGITLYDLDDIIRCQSESNYTYVFSKSEDKIITAKTLKEFEELLGNYGFERVHNSHLINVKHIKKYINKDGGYLIMSDNSSVPIAQRKKTAVLRLLENLI